MTRRASIVLDFGKTNAKASLWAADGSCIAVRTRENRSIDGLQYRELDCQGIASWLAECLEAFAGLARPGTIVPCGHGAASALICDDELFLAPFDYEGAISMSTDYEAQRDPFSETGSPSLANGLNLGRQLHRLEQLSGRSLPETVQILTWPQYWAWVLCGVPSVEVSSLGCHTDLWCPREGRYSDLAQNRGWARRMAPLREAGEILGRVSPEWVKRTGLPADCTVHCGMHDSNAALHAARGHAELRGADTTVLSTGTWFVAMRSIGKARRCEDIALDEGRDCLLNVDPEGRPVPSARFMGGREFELLIEGSPADEDVGIDLRIAQAAQVIANGVVALPSVVSGVGPFPAQSGGWVGSPPANWQRAPAASLYLALMSDVMLEMIGSHEGVLIEGRFAGDTLLARTLASVRPDLKVYTVGDLEGVAFGALRLIDPELRPPSALQRIEPLPLDLRQYKTDWRKQLEPRTRAACR